jgi:hypothetical protein
MNNFSITAEMNYRLSVIDFVLIIVTPILIYPILE